MEHLGDVGHVESRSVYFEMVLVLVQDRCTVYAKCTIGSGTILDSPDGTPRCRGSCGISFDPFGYGDSVYVR